MGSVEESSSTPIVVDFRDGASRRRASRFSRTKEQHGAGVEGGNLRGISNKHHHCMLIHKYALTTVQARVQTSCAVRACVRAFLSRPIRFPMHTNSRYLLAVHNNMILTTTLSTIQHFYANNAPSFSFFTSPPLKKLSVLPELVDRLPPRFKICTGDLAEALKHCSRKIPAIRRELESCDFCHFVWAKVEEQGV